MDFFKDNKKVSMAAIPLGFLGVFVAVVGVSTDTEFATVIGIFLTIASGALWTLHGIAEDSDK